MGNPYSVPQAAQLQGSTAAPTTGGTTYYDSVSGKYYDAIPSSYGTKQVTETVQRPNNNSFGFNFGNNGSYEITKTVDNPVDAQTFIKLTNRNQQPSAYPTTNNLFPLMSLLNMLSTTGLEGSSGAGRFLGTNSLLSPSYANYQANSGNANANTAGKGNDLGS
jgi:hypothetical protein